MIIFLTVIEFLCGSLMFSYWLGLAVKKDLRKIGDGNPGAFNLWSTAGYKIGILGVFLDFMKGYVPLVLLINGGYLKGLAIVPVALAPILGHAFSPFMRFKGGKAIAATFGVWSAVTGFEVSLVYAIILAILKITAKLLNRGKRISPESDAFQVVLGICILGIYLAVRAFPEYIFVLWFFNFSLLVYTNKTKLQTFFSAAY